MNPNKIEPANPGTSNGNVTVRNVRPGDAPRFRAASSTAGSTARNSPSNMRCATGKKVTNCTKDRPGNP